MAHESDEISHVYSDFFLYESTLKQAEAEYSSHMSNPKKSPELQQYIKTLKVFIQECREKLISIQKFLHEESKRT